MFVNLHEIVKSQRRINAWEVKRSSLLLQALETIPLRSCALVVPSACHLNAKFVWNAELFSPKTSALKFLYNGQFTLSTQKYRFAPALLDVGISPARSG